MVALDELSRRNQTNWHGGSLTSVYPAPSGVGLQPDLPPASTRGRPFRPAVERGGRFQTSRRVVPIALMIAAVLTAGGLALAEGIHSPQQLRQGTPRPPSQGTAPAPAVSSTSTTISATTVSSAPPPNANSGLVLQALSPGVGSAGQQITLSGSGFIGTDGYIAATFDGVVVPTRCPTEQTCFVTTPARGSGEATVRLRTSAGESNSLVFRFESSHVS
jgi:hypothetical protein